VEARGSGKEYDWTLPKLELSADGLLPRLRFVLWDSAAQVNVRVPHEGFLWVFPQFNGSGP